MYSNNVCSLIIWIWLFAVYHGCYSSVSYDISECQECSAKENLVPCKIQNMHDNCLSAMTAVHGKQWPGPPRELEAKEILTENDSHAKFTWKPPYDASIHSLKGFLLRITHYEDYKGTFVLGSPWCFFLNLTDGNWTDSTNAYDTKFSFNCIKSNHPAKVTLSISSIPRPHKSWQVIKQSVYLQGTVPFYQWKPNITVRQLDSSCVGVEVNPPFPNAARHAITVNLADKPTGKAAFSYPNNNTTLCFLTPGQNYSIQVKPYDKDNQSLSHYIQYSPVRLESTVSKLAYEGDKNKKMQVVTWVVIPLVLVIVITITVFVFCHRGILQRKSQTLNVPPNNIADQENITVAIIYCSENNFIENAVHSLGEIVRESTGFNVEFISDSRIVEPNKKQLFLVTEGIHQINHVQENSNRYWSNKAFSSGKAFLQRYHNQKEKHPPLLLLSPIVSENWLDCCIFKNINVPTFYHITDSEEVQLNFSMLDNILNCVCQQEKIRSKAENCKDISNLENYLFLLYLYMRDNRKWFEEDFLVCNGEEEIHQTQPLLPYPTSQYSQHHQLYNEKAGLYKKRSLDLEQSYQSKTHSKPPQLSASLNGQGIPYNERMSDVDVFDSGISDQDIKVDIHPKDEGRLDSGIDSIPLDEISPFLHGSTDFIPPDSDTDSLDINAQSLGRHMLEINRRNVQYW